MCVCVFVYVCVYIYIYLYNVMPQRDMSNEECKEEEYVPRQWDHICAERRV